VCAKQGVKEVRLPCGTKISASIPPKPSPYIHLHVIEGEDVCYPSSLSINKEDRLGCTNRMCGASKFILTLEHEGLEQVIELLQEVSRASTIGRSA